MSLRCWCWLQDPRGRAEGQSHMIAGAVLLLTGLLLQQTETRGPQGSQSPSPAEHLQEWSATHGVCIVTLSHAQCRQDHKNCPTRKHSHLWPLAWQANQPKITLYTAR